MVPEVVYLGRRITPEGILSVKKKVEAIHDVLPPKNAMDLQASLGLLNYYHRFLPNVSALLALLHELLRKRVVCVVVNDNRKL